MSKKVQVKAHVRAFPGRKKKAKKAKTPKPGKGAQALLPLGVKP